MNKTIFKNISQFNNQELNLEILAEEAAEVIQIKSKIIRFGIDDYHPKQGVNNRLKLEEEIGHFIAMVEILIHQGVINKKGVEEGRDKKFNKLPKYYRYSIVTKENNT